MRSMAVRIFPYTNLSKAAFPDSSQSSVIGKTGESILKQNRFVGTKNSRKYFQLKVVGFDYIQLNKTGLHNSSVQDMANPTTMCKLCSTPLTGHEQFIGHMIHSHELPFEEAAFAWQIMNNSYQAQPLLVGG